MSSVIKELPMKNDIKIALLDQSIITINETLKRIEGKIDKLDSKIDHCYQSLNLRLWNNFLWLVGFGIALYGSLFAVIAHALKWF